MARPFMYLNTGKPNPDQGRIEGERIDKAVEKAVDAFWAKFVEEFPEVQTGDMGPGDEDQFEDAALAVARIWLMWNHPDGMPEDVDPEETPPPVLNICLFEHTQPTEIVQTPKSGPYAGQGLCGEHWIAAREAGDVPEYECRHEPAHMVHLHVDGDVVEPSAVDPEDRTDTDEERYDCDPRCAVEGFEYPTIEG